MSDVVLRTEGLRKEFGNNDRILQGADLTLYDGEILMLMGPNGVGKTVLLSCLAGSVQPSAGRIELFGTQAPSGGHAAIEFMLQDSKAIERLTGRENVAFYQDLNPTFTDRWHEYTETLGLADDLDKRVEHYSEGMKRKLEFALSMSADVPIYLLDEPTAGVDLTNVQRFHDAILERRAEGGTFVVSSHRPIDATIADRIAFIPDGTVTAVDEPNVLLGELPPVVTVSGREAMDAVEPLAVEQQLFPVGGEARAFVPAAEDIDSVYDTVETAEGIVDQIDPTYTDLFNYYVHIDQSRDAASG